MSQETRKNNELLKLTASQVRENNYDKVILAVGSCEAHGHHLAEGTDTLVSYMLSKKVADEVDGLLVLPPITVGYSRHYEQFPFTLSLGYDTTIAVIHDILKSVLDNGIEKIFIMNGHDGNIAPIEIASRKIKEDYPNAKIAALTEWWLAAGDLLPEGTFEVWNGSGHAGEGESSIAYYLYPQWNQPEKATSVIPDNLIDHIDIKWTFDEITDTGQTGDATKATAEKGKMMTEVLVKCMVDAIEELDKKDWDYTSTQSQKKF